MGKDFCLRQGQYPFLGIPLGAGEGAELDADAGGSGRQGMAGGGYGDS